MTVEAAGAFPAGPLIAAPVGIGDPVVTVMVEIWVGNPWRTGEYE